METSAALDAPEQATRTPARDISLSGSFLIWEVELQAAACRHQVDQGLAAAGAGAPWAMSATRAPARSRGKPGAGPAQRPPPGRRRPGEGPPRRAPPAPRPAKPA